EFLLPSFFIHLLQSFILYISSSDFKYCKGGYIEGHFLRKD
ncbi:unnamed protein product, partial [Larinioides sclopetarius]